MSISRIRQFNSLRKLGVNTKAFDVESISSIRLPSKNSFTNELALELNELRKGKNLTFRNLLAWFLEILGRSDTVSHVNSKKLHKGIELASKRFASMYRLKNDQSEKQWKSFLSNSFKFYPNDLRITTKANTEDLKINQIESELRKVTIQTLKAQNENDNLRKEAIIHKDVIIELSESLGTATKKLKTKEKDLNIYTDRVIRIRKKINIQKKTNALLGKRLSFQRNQIGTLKTIARCERKRLTQKIKYWENKCHENQIKHEVRIQEVEYETEELKLENETLKSELENTSRQLNLTLAENENLEQLVNQHDIELTKPAKNGKYTFTSDTDLCILSLLDSHVAYDQVAAVMKSVMRLCKVNCASGKYPQKDYVSKLGKCKLPLSQLQLAEICCEDNSDNQTLYTDETRKYGKAYGVFATTDVDRNPYLLGLRQMSNKASKTQFDTLKDILSDIEMREHILKHRENESIGYRILKNIRYTMSDRAATEIAFNDLLEKYRSSLLKEHVENFNELADEEQHLVTKMYNFFCGLHLTINIADVVNEVFASEQSSELENDLGSSVKSSESDTIRAVRCCSKAFTSGSDEKNGCSLEFLTYLKRKNIRANDLKPFLGNRFNVAFHNGGAVYFYHLHIRQFLETVKSEGNLNRLNGLLKYVHSAVSKDEIIHGCRVLGILNKFVTGPLLKILENANTHILEMNTHYETLVNFLKDVSTNTEKMKELLTGEYVPFPTVQVKKDEVWSALVQLFHDAEYVALLTKICSAICKALQQKVKDHLPEGRYYRMDIENQDLKEAMSSVLPHNKLPERIFGYLDWLLHHRPNASRLANEAHLMFHVNGTGKWLKSKSIEESTKIIVWAKTQVSSTENIEKRRVAELENELQRISEEKERKALNLKKKKMKEKMRVTNEILKLGLWQKPSKITIVLKKLKYQKHKREALKNQIKFRQLVLMQTAKKELFQICRIKGKQITIAQLSLNLKTLIMQSNELESNVETQDHDDIIGNEVTRKSPKINAPHNDCQCSSCVKIQTGEIVSFVPGFPTWYNIAFGRIIASYEFQQALDSGTLQMKNGSTRCEE